MYQGVVLTGATGMGKWSYFCDFYISTVLKKIKFRARSTAG